MRKILVILSGTLFLTLILSRGVIAESEIDILDTWINIVHIKIIDIDTQQPVTGAHVYIEGNTGISADTDNEGIASLTVPNGFTNEGRIVVIKEGYQEGYRPFSKRELLQVSELSIRIQKRENTQLADNNGSETDSSSGNSFEENPATPPEENSAIPPEENPAIPPEENPAIPPEENPATNPSEERESEPRINNTPKGVIETRRRVKKILDELETIGLDLEELTADFVKAVSIDDIDFDTFRKKIRGLNLQIATLKNNMFKYELELSTIYLDLKLSKTDLRNSNVFLEKNMQYARDEIVKKEQKILELEIILNHMESENKQLETLNKRLNIRLYVVVSLLLLALLLSYWIWKGRKKVRIESDKNERLNGELNHRIGNILSRIEAIISAQSENAENNGQEEIVIALNSLVSRIVPLNHIQRLLSDDQGNPIPIRSLVETITDNMKEFEGQNIAKPKINIDDNVNISLKRGKAQTLALIINELITNIYKHAFKKCKKGHYSVSLKKIEAARYQLEVTDNGLGYDKNNVKKNTGWGVTDLLVNEDLKGSIDRQSTPEKGTKVIIKFPHKT